MVWMVLNITVHTLPLFVKGGKGNLFIASCVCAVMNIRCTSKQSYWLRVLFRYCTPKNGDFKIHITLYSVKMFFNASNWSPRAINQKRKNVGRSTISAISVLKSIAKFINTDQGAKTMSSISKQNNDITICNRLLCTLITHSVKDLNYIVLCGV